MNDVDILVGLFLKWGVGHRVDNTPDKFSPGVHTVITCEQGMAKVDGYSTFFTELESGPKESALLSSALGIPEPEIKTRLEYLVETGFVIISGTTYGVVSEKLAKFMENDENYKGVVDGLTELDSYLN